MRGKVVWIAFGVLLVAGIVAGYYPDMQLAREESAARTEGLLQTGTVEKIPDAQDARQAYIAAFGRNREGVRKLQGNPSVETTHPSPEVRRLLADVEAASCLPRFSVPRTTFPSNGITSSDALPVGELYFSTIALTKTAVDEKGLLAAARIAGHLREGDPVPTPAPLWAAMAGRVLTGVARLHLQDPARRRVLEALRPYPDLQDWMRKHVAVTYAATEKVRSQSAGRAQDRARFLRFWRGFLKDLPTDPDALAKTIGTRSAEIDRIEYRIAPSYSTYTPGMPVMASWSDWATHTNRTAKNIDRLLGKP